MIPPLVSLKEMKLHLGSLNCAHDPDITLKIELASEIVMDYLKKESIPTDWITPDSDPEEINVPGVVRAATLLVAEKLLKNRRTPTPDVLTPTVCNLLHRRRDPAMA